MKKLILLVCAFAFSVLKGFAQFRCVTDEVNLYKMKQHPEIYQYQAEMERQIEEAMKQIDFRKAERTTSGDSQNWDYYIPIVVHIVHDYGQENISDSALNSYLKLWNVVYNKQNADTSSVIPTYAGFIPNSHTPYIGNPRIHLQLATKDPYGNPTHGVLKHRSALSFYAGDNAKFEPWSPSSYINIWVINVFSYAHESAAAYAIMPPTAAAEPYYDGFITIYSYMGVDYVCNHEMSHLLNLEHPWGMTNNAAVSCGDDEVDDTPPTMGNNDCNNRYDTNCATGYLKVYPSMYPGVDSLVDYPDTCNVENIMNYSYCCHMFTEGQVVRMHACLNSTIANRNNLSSAANWAATGTGPSRVWIDIPPTPDFYVSTPRPGVTAAQYNYICGGSNSQHVTFTNASYNDTVMKIVWNFSNNAGTPTVTNTANNRSLYSNPGSATASTNFLSPGWVTVTMNVYGNNGAAGAGALQAPVTLVDSQRVFVADSMPTPAANYYQEFNGVNDYFWPTFNYYNNEFKWQKANVGYFDNSSMMYTGFDSRWNYLQGQYPATGVPRGDFDDMFSPYFDMSSLASDSSVYLHFMYAAASRTNVSQDISDTLEIAYSTNCSTTWQTLKTLQKSTLVNRGTVSTSYVPASSTEWSLASIPFNASLLSAIRSGAKVAFRFRYRPGIDYAGYTTANYEGVSTGNNFYMDRVSFSSSTLGIQTVAPNEMGNSVIITPNPTNSEAHVLVKDLIGSDIKIVVTDITGKTVYTANMRSTDAVSVFTVPSNAIKTGGMYLVNITTPNQNRTEKLVVY
jgi:hypothetical protein